MIYGYIRVSSDKQTVENQRFEINKFCEKKGLKINDWIEETISGTKNYSKRRLGNLLKNGGTDSCRSAVFFGLEEYEGRGLERESGRMGEDERGRKRTERTGTGL